MQDKDFLQGYEVRNLDFSPRMYKIFAIAAIVNFIGLFAIGQTNMLAQSACESPFVNRICTVLDTVYFSSKMLTTDTGYVVEEYAESKIKESDVVWIDQTNVEPSLTYPAGYFQIANRDELAMLEQNGLEAFPSDPITPIQPPPPPILPPSRPNLDDPLARRQNLPKRKGSLIEGDLPEDTDTSEDGKNPDDDTVANKDNTNDKPEIVDPPGSAPAVEINKKPLYDFVDTTLAKVNSNRVDLRRPFKVVMNAYINEEGRLDIEKSRWITAEEEGDPEMILVAKDAVEKLGDSGWLVYLTKADIKNVRIVFYQDEESLAADVTAIMPNENRARSTAVQFAGYISAAIFAHNNNIKKFKEDELTLLKAAGVDSERNLLKIKFNLKKEVAHPIINTRLREYQADKAKQQTTGPTPKQPNGSIEKANAGNRADR
ncbi:MAG: hypothetical protein J5I65_10910 [Aridibacter famidurans]|nr:hypothetical protein [Aridibacter famidurans]